MNIIKRLALSIILTIHICEAMQEISLIKTQRVTYIDALPRDIRDHCIHKWFGLKDEKDYNAGQVLGKFLYDSDTNWPSSNQTLAIFLYFFHSNHTCIHFLPLIQYTALHHYMML